MADKVEPPAPTQSAATATPSTSAPTPRANPLRVPNVLIPTWNKNAKAAQTHLSQARAYYRESNYSFAFKHYVEYFEAVDRKSYDGKAEKEFTKLVLGMRQMKQFFDQDDVLYELLKCFIQAVNLFPKNYYLLNNLGIFMYMTGEYDIAIKYMNDALSIKPDNLSSKFNIMHIKWHQIPRWHFRMLNDRIRNLQYKKAIQTALDEGFNQVIDIGAGTGLLSLYAGSHPSKPAVLGVEVNETLHSIFQKVVTDTGLQNIEACHMHSMDLKEVLSPKALVVTEIFDVSVFGEHILPCLVHGYNELFSKGSYRIIPQKANIFITGISNEKIAAKHRFTNKIPQLGLENICVTETPNSSRKYKAENLRDLKVGYITETDLFMTVDFNDEKQIRFLHNDQWSKQTIKLKCLKEGTIDAFAVWFYLYLDQNTVLNTDPMNKDCLNCWEQAIFPLKHPIKVHSGDIVHLNASLISSCFQFEVLSPKMDCPRCYTASKGVIKSLNDKSVVDFLVPYAESFPPAKNETDSIVDYHEFPLLGLLLTKKGYTLYNIWHDDSSQNYDLYGFITAVNKIDNSKVNCTTLERQQDLLGMVKGIKYVFYESIDPDGLIRDIETNYKAYSEMKAVLLPRRVSIQFQLIYSEYLNFSNKLDDKNVEPFGMAKYMNEFSGYQHIQLENEFKFTPVTQIIQCTVLKDNQLILKAPIARSGKINAIYHWYMFDMHDKKFNTRYSTYYNKAAFFFETRNVKSGDELSILVKREEGFMDIKIVDNPPQNP